MTRLELVEKRLDRVEQAFPAQDYDGHRRGHEAWIERTAELRRLRIAIQEKTIAGLFFAAVLWIGMAILHEIQRYIGMNN